MQPVEVRTGCRPVCNRRKTDTDRLHAVRSGLRPLCLKFRTGPVPVASFLGQKTGPDRTLKHYFQRPETQASVQAGQASTWPLQPVPADQSFTLGIGSCLLLSKIWVAPWTTSQPSAVKPASLIDELVPAAYRAARAGQSVWPLLVQGNRIDNLVEKFLNP